jgi:putative endonuclease
MPKPLVYVLESERNGRFYIGWTSDIDTRLAAHNAGVVKATRYLKPWRLAYTEDCDTETAARQREWYLKQLKSRVSLQALIKRGQSAPM